jgi:hypothetical protein
MDLAANPLYPNSRPYELIIFDTRIPGASRSYSRLRALWGEDAEVEMLDLDHPVLVVRPGGARRGRR